MGVALSLVEAAVSFKISAALAELNALLCYVVFIPLAVCCSKSSSVTITMCIFALLTTMTEMYAIVIRGGRDAISRSKPCFAIVYDFVQVCRVLLTTLLPALLVTYGGGSFLFLLQMESLAEDCHVADLPRLLEEGYWNFECVDGHVAVEHQVEITSVMDVDRGLFGHDRRLESFWKSHHYVDAPEEDPLRRLTAPRIRMRPVHEGNATEDLLPPDARMTGHVAPIFSNRVQARTGPPVAWAVKAGSPIKRSMCAGFIDFEDEDLPLGTCGINALYIRDRWREYHAPVGFGQEWGFNITHFHHADMVAGVERVMANLGARAMVPNASEVTFVVAEGIEEYFGSCYILSWVTICLLCTGLLDRLVTFAKVLAFAKSFDPIEREETPRNGYGRVKEVTEEDTPGVDPNEEQPLWSNLWFNPLGAGSRAEPGTRDMELSVRVLTPR